MRWLRHHWLTGQVFRGQPLTVGLANAVPGAVLEERACCAQCGRIRDLYRTRGGRLRAVWRSPTVRTRIWAFERQMRAGVRDSGRP